MSAAATSDRGQPDTFPAEMRTRWRKAVVEEVMRCAGLFNLVTYGETELSDLPADAYTLAVRLVDDLVRKACTEEQRVGRRPGSLRRVVAAAHDAMKPYARRGELYVEHLIDRQAQLEFESRLFAGISGARYETESDGNPSKGSVT